MQFHQQPHYPQMHLPAHAYKTYSINSPLSTHYRDGTCDEAGCLAQRNGWKTTVDESQDLGQKQAHYIRKLAGRKYTETRTEAGLTEFTFEAGQQCFARHKVPLHRPEFYSVRGRGLPWQPVGQTRNHSGPDPWLNDFGDHQDKLKRAVEG